MRGAFIKERGNGWAQEVLGGHLEKALCFTFSLMGRKVCAKFRKYLPKYL
jgi:hypothetical protein